MLPVAFTVRVFALMAPRGCVMLPPAASETAGAPTVPISVSAPPLPMLIETLSLTEPLTIREEVSLSAKPPALVNEPSAPIVFPEPISESLPNEEPESVPPPTIAASPVWLIDPVVATSVTESEAFTVPPVCRISPTSPL